MATPENQAAVAALLRSVREAPPHAPPAVTCIRRRVTDAHGADAWVWAEVKLYSDGEYCYGIARDVTSEKRVRAGRCVSLTPHNTDEQTSSRPVARWRRRCVHSCSPPGTHGRELNAVARSTALLRPYARRHTQPRLEDALLVRGEPRENLFATRPAAFSPHELTRARSTRAARGARIAACSGMQCASALLAARAGVAADAEATYLLNVVRASTSLMLGTINNVLDLRALEAAGGRGGGGGGGIGQLRTRERVAVAALFADVLDVARVAFGREIFWVDAADAAQLPAELQVCIRSNHKNTPSADLTWHAAAQGNPERLRQVFQNMAVVCVHYAEGQAPIEASLRCTEESGDSGSVQLHAAFTLVGRALAPAQAADAFNPYAAANAKDATPYSTSARLALLVARSLARGMDGDLSLAAAPDGSARLELRVRLFKPGAPTLAQEQQASAPAVAAPSAAAASSPMPAPRASQPAVAARSDAPPAAPTKPASLTAQMFEYLTKHSDESACWLGTDVKLDMFADCVLTTVCSLSLGSDDAGGSEVHIHQCVWRRK